jgi:hypothetical protein
VRSPGSERVSPNLPITCNMFSRPAIWMIGHRPSGETTHIDAAAARPPHFAASGNRHSGRTAVAIRGIEVAHNRQYALPDLCRDGRIPPSQGTTQNNAPAGSPTYVAASGNRAII